MAKQERDRGKEREKGKTSKMRERNRKYGVEKKLSD